jgi:exosortase K
MNDRSTAHFASVVPTAVLLSMAFALKWWYRTATVDDLGFVLAPVAALVSWLTGEGFVLDATSGYLFSGLRILIDRSCSGVNFLVIAIASFALVLFPRNPKYRPSLWWSLAVLPLAYLLTIVVNSGRIVLLIALERARFSPSPLAHEAIGAFYFLGTLLLVSILLDHLIRHRHANAA